jgi:hypothetical protein
MSHETFEFNCDIFIRFAAIPEIRVRLADIGLEVDARIKQMIMSPNKLF